MIPNHTGIYLTNDILNKYFIPLALSVLTFYHPIMIFLALAAGLTMADCYFAWRLSVRVKKLHKKSKGKLSSCKIRRATNNLFEAMLLILAAFAIDKIIIQIDDMFLTRIVTGAYAIRQLISCLENASSSNGSKWARLAQKILVDKSSRHYDVDLNDKQDDK